jgi:hypothetical protein
MLLCRSMFSGQKKPYGRAFLAGQNTQGKSPLPEG